MTDAAITLRPVEPDDEPFLIEVYGSTRADELAQTGWDAEQRAAFIRMQFEAQTRDYSARFPGAEYRIVMVDGEPAGRIWVVQSDAEIRLLDVALLPAYRNRGVGGVLIQRLQVRARTEGLPLRHSVYRMNTAALRFYERHGFEVVEDFETYLLMEWTAVRPERST